MHTYKFETTAGTNRWEYQWVRKVAEMICFMRHHIVQNCSGGTLGESIKS